MDYLYHYYEKSFGPFRNLSDLSIEEAQSILDRIKKENTTFAAHRFDGYLQRRQELEQMAKGILISKGGKPQRLVPHYMVVGECDWLKTWYTDGDFVRIPLSEFDISTLSFCYGDMFPTFSPRVTDGREYRGQVYTYNEIQEVIKKYGLPQCWNRDGQHGPERYVEVHVWNDEPIVNYLPKCTP
jgi:hypothetical protein